MSESARNVVTLLVACAVFGIGTLSALAVLRVGVWSAVGQPVMAAVSGPTTPFEVLVVQALASVIAGTTLAVAVTKLVSNDGVVA